jgi:hypothetical protein
MRAKAPFICTRLNAPQLIVDELGRLRVTPCRFAVTTALTIPGLLARLISGLTLVFTLAVLIGVS